MRTTLLNNVVHHSGDFCPTAELLVYEYLQCKTAERSSQCGDSVSPWSFVVSPGDLTDICLRGYRICVISPTA